MSRAVAIIPARGGSKGILRKNLREVGGAPLVVHTIRQALESSSVDRVYVSTDDTEIRDVSQAAGAHVIHRPVDISGDTISSEAVIHHALPVMRQEGDFDLVVFLQATAPLRAKGDIDGAVATLVREEADSLLSVSRSHRFLWRQGTQGPEAINYDPAHRPRRQDLEAQFVENGSIYVFKPWVLERYDNRLGGRIALYEMTASAAFDIDDEIDLAVIDLLMTRRFG
ncbi:cytidylyltransferase domain-containing protein [Paramagnetospirillum magneticum]|uniref:CMP-N-acetylneuraminic acid synthetase n=1 Tax=Paramagnetospirillum magneticum (strain ATCC 700264 / AMB-1) TaxID=342108 RepID=Q2WB80_PARM1|nr:acylneuraminate cytidylyltransferase family protein [Paramagnetospirillum magneticum]BAE48895.1 CMP-N-acetylneuraminic acid synthetase [Paramagnetospirillum magneticum AMB-1]